MKELYIYTPILDFTAEFFIRSMEEAKNEPVAIRMYTPGGDPMASWGMILKVKEHQHPVKLKVDGKADSAGAYFCLYIEDTQAISTSQFLLHRAHFRNIPNPVGVDLARMNEVNKELRAKMEAQLDIPLFEELAGVTLDEFFTGENVIDVNLNAENAKKIRLIKKIVNLADEDIKAMGLNFAAYSGNDPRPEPKKEIDMKLVELKTKHPELYAEVVAIGKSETPTTAVPNTDEIVKAERDRVNSWMVYNKLDPIAVAKGIESGEVLSQTNIAEFSIKSVNATALAAIAASNADDTETEENSELENAIVAYTDALKGDDKELIASTKAALTAVKGNVEGPQAENEDAFVKELRKNMNLDKSSDKK